ncbi:MAG: DUF4124 domain-containing protein [Hahellaceae bacterium]|nr:DUF4124 domain-containing protein [Hahellaceae bacterium]MCP5212685.1 DUF4124 domain-containing protein [Hahellaceae bacterium]
MIKPRQTFLLLLYMCLIAPLSVSAAKMFKWVDENGVTHFGSTPPPPQKIKENKVEVEELSTPGSDKKESSSDYRIRGEWWAAKDTRATLKLKLSYDDFEFSENFVGSYGITKANFASGKYKLSNDVLELTYFEHQGEPEKLDTTENYEVTYLDDTKLVIVQDFVKKLTFKRQRQTDSTDFSRELKGEWSDQKGQKYKFDHGTFIMYFPNNNNHTRQIGNWEWQDPELTLDFIADYGDPIDNNIGRMHRWIIQKRSYQEMVFVDQGTGSTLILKRDR